MGCTVYYQGTLNAKGTSNQLQQVLYYTILHDLRQFVSLTTISIHYFYKFAVVAAADDRAEEGSNALYAEDIKNAQSSSLRKSASIDKQDGKTAYTVSDDEDIDGEASDGEASCTDQQGTRGCPATPKSSSSTTATLTPPAAHDFKADRPVRRTRADAPVYTEVDDQLCKPKKKTASKRKHADTTPVKSPTKSHRLAASTPVKSPT